MFRPAQRFVQFFLQEWLPGYRREKGRWNRSVSKEKPVLFYGYDDISGNERSLSGGLVKVRDLLPVFPNSSVGANILYLVSSSLPAFPPAFAGLFFPKLTVLMVRLARKSGVKIVLNQNGVAYPAWYGKGWQRANRVNKFLLQAADYVIYQSIFCKESANKFIGKCKGDWDILYNPVDTSYFSPAQDISRKDSEIIVGLMGSHWQKYRVHNTIEAIALLRKQGLKVRLRIGGRLCWDNNFENAEVDITKWAEQYDVLDSVCYFGPYTQEEAVKHFQLVDLLVHPKFNDPCPRVVIEALACGVPVVYSASGGVPELVGDKAGVGIAAPVDWEQMHPPSSQDLANALEKILFKRHDYAAAARQRAEKYFGIQHWLDAHAKIFEDVLKK